MYEAATDRSGIVCPAHLTYAYGEIADAAAEC
jgi:hypothetical protein